MLEVILAKLKREPLRARLYSLVVLVAAYLLKRDVIDATDAEFIGAVASIVLVVESARRKVSPVRR